MLKECRLWRVERNEGRPADFRPANPDTIDRFNKASCDGITILIVD